jgi:Mn2+/Fe2+ NRAMP family transporter
VPIAALGIWLIIVRGSYRSAERIFIWLTIPFFAYPIAAVLAHPNWGDVGKAIVVPHIHTSSSYLLLLIATAGTTITPYMQLYLQSAVVERGVREEELGREQREAVAGAVFANLIAAFIIIATGATLFTHGVHSISSAADAARALGPFAGHYAEVLFGVGLLGASLLAAAILPIATAYVISESLGYEKGVGRRREEAPVFVNIITAMIMLSAFVAIIPGIPVISLLVGVQVVNGVLLPINLFFIWRLARSRQVMGERRNRGVLDGAAGITVAVTSTLSIGLVVITVLGL